MRHSRPHRLAGALLAGLLAAGLLAAGALAGCGTADDPPAATGSPSPPPPARMSPVPADAAYNAADVVFAQETLQHLRQAVRMAGLAKTRAQAPAVKQLAAKADKDRGDVVILLEKWLAEQRQPAPSTPPTVGQAGGKNGLATEAELATLAGAKGRPFDRLFLQMLIINNESATVLLKGQQWSGKAPELMAIAHKLQDDHEAELPAARRLLGR
jgi:uncharacterized protein (DUF305 family)